jgi:hypothetical protein
MTTNEPLFGIFALSPFTQQIHSKYTNQRILDCFHHDYYRIADDLLVRSHHCEAHDDVGPTPIENRASSNPPQVPPINASKVDITTSIGVKIPFLQLSYYENQTAMLGCSKGIEIFNLQHYMNGILHPTRRKPPPPDDISQLHINLSPLKPKYSNKTHKDSNGVWYTDSNGVKLTEKSAHDLVNLPPPSLFQIVPTVEYNYSRISELECVDKIPAHHIASILILDITKPTAFLVLSQFILKTTQALLHGSIFPLINVQIHVVLLDGHMVDERLITTEKITEKFASIGIEEVYFHNLPLFPQFLFTSGSKLTLDPTGVLGLEHATSIQRVRDGHKTLTPVSPIAEKHNLTHLLSTFWILIYAKHFSLHHESQLPSDPDQKKEFRILPPTIWPSMTYLNMLHTHTANSYTSIPLSAFTKPTHELPSLIPPHPNTETNEGLRIIQ